MKFQFVLVTLLAGLSGCQKETHKIPLNRQKPKEIEFHPKPTLTDLTLSAQALLSDLSYLKNNIEVVLNKSGTKYKNGSGRSCTKSGSANGENCSHFIEYSGCKLLKGFISGTQCYDFDPKESLESIPDNLPLQLILGNNEAMHFSSNSNFNGISTTEDADFYLVAKLVTSKNSDQPAEVVETKEYAFTYEVKSRTGFRKKSGGTEEKIFEGTAGGKGAFLITPDPAQKGKFLLHLKEGAELNFERSHLGNNKEGKRANVFTIKCSLKNTGVIEFDTFPCSLPNGTFGLECQVKDGEHSQIETHSIASKGGFQLGGNAFNKWSCAY